MKGKFIFGNGTRSFGALALTLVAGSALAQRSPTATYTASGSAGNWDLKFTLTNNFLPGEGDFYFFGVYLDTGRNIASTPSGWDSNRFQTWNNVGYGGSNFDYNNVWINLYSRPNDVHVAQSMSTWEAISNDVVAPTNLKFFAFAAGGTYTGTDYFDNYWNPGFEGTAQLVPEPASLMILSLGLLALKRRRRR